MTTPNERRTTLRDIARVAFRHWRKIAVTVLGVLALTAVAISLYPRSYSSESKLLVRIGRETVGLDPTATTGETIMLQKTQDDEVNSALNILASRSVLEQVVDRIGAARILNDQPKTKSEPSGTQTQLAAFQTWLGAKLDALGLRDPGTEVDRAVRKLEKKYLVWAAKQSMVINIRYTAASPELAHDVVEQITKVFLAERARLNQTDGSLEFFVEQTDKLRRELAEAQSELRDRKNAFQLTTSTNQLSILEKTKEAMRQKVYDLEMQEVDLSSRYHDGYPLLRDVRREREAAQKALMSMYGGSEQQRAKISNVSLPASTEVDQAPSIVTPDFELKALNDQEFELVQLEREVRLLERKYEMHVSKLEQARLNDALGREQIGNVKIAQPATLVHKPVSPQKPLLLSLGLLTALIGGVGIAYLSETFDQTLRTTDQVEAQLQLPVLASLANRKSEQEDSYRGLVAAIRSLPGTHNAKTVGVMDCEATDARSRVAADVAIQAATTGGDSVLLIDADPQRRQIAKRFGLNGAPGWREVVAGNADARNCIQATKSEGLAVMGPGGENGTSASAPWSSQSMTQLDNVKQDFGLVVVDLPPTQEQDGLPAISNWIDEMVLVVEAEKTRIQAAERARDSLTRAGVNVAGVVLVNRREHIPTWLYKRL
jgi:uncharacterized protein involved in exopolysaccharide biosynthesis/Mrp family chromosome partitioning ATPase